MSDEIARSFDERCHAARRAVWRVIRQRRPAEPGLVWADVCLKAWRQYPRLYAQERAALAAGQPSPHDWTGWMVTIAVRHLIDVHRRTHGRRPVACPRDAARSSRPRHRVVLLPLYDQIIPAPAVSDPAVLLELRETWQAMNDTLASLDRDERLALSSVVVEGVEDAQVAARLGTSPRTVRRRRKHAIVRVHGALLARGLGAVRHFRAAA